MQNEPRKRRISGWKPAKGQTSVDKVTRPHTVTLGWHLFGACRRSARALHLAIFGWSALFFFLQHETQPSRGPPDQMKAAPGSYPFDVFIMRVLRSSQHFFFFCLFFHPSCNKACFEWLWCYCSVEIDSLMRPFSENVMHMNYNELCSCLHLLYDEGWGGGGEKRGPNSY